MLSKLTTHPALHFWLIGLIVFLSASAFEPAPVLTVQYPTDQRIAELERQWSQLGAGALTGDAKAKLIQTEIDRDILLAESLRLHFHLQDQGVQARLIRDMRFMYEGSEETDEVLLDQAYAMNLHVNDLVARRRLVQMMESSLRAVGERQPVSEQTLRDTYENEKEKYLAPERFTFTQVFIQWDQNRQDTEQRAKEIFKTISDRSAQPDEAISLGNPFISGHRFVDQSLAQLTREFGPTFTAALANCRVNTWCAAVPSPYGLHHVWLSDQKLATRLPSDQVKSSIEYTLRNQAGEKSLSEGLARLRDRYQVMGAPQ
jgi:hypothetical protein